MIALFKPLRLKQLSHASNASRSPGTQRQECASIQSDTYTCRHKRTTCAKNSGSPLPRSSNLSTKAKTFKEETKVRYRALDDPQIRCGPRSSLAKGSYFQRRRRNQPTSPPKAVFEATAGTQAPIMWRSSGEDSASWANKSKALDRSWNNPTKARSWNYYA